MMQAACHGAHDRRDDHTTKSAHKALLTEIVDAKDRSDRLARENEQLNNLIYGGSPERHVADENSPFQAHLFDNPDLTEDFAREKEKAEETEITTSAVEGR